MLLQYLVKCKHLKTCAAITLKSYNVTVSHMFNQLLILSQNLLKISSSNWYMRSQMRVPLVNCLESSSSFSRTALSHTQSPRQNIWSLEQATPQLISPE